MAKRAGTGLPVRTSDGVDLNVVEYGSGALTVVLLHGWTLDHRLWRRQIADLPERLGENGSGAGVRIGYALQDGVAMVYVVDGKDYRFADGSFA